MFSVTNFELMKLRSGESNGCTRRYPAGCPHEVGSQIPLVEEQRRGKAKPFAIAVITSIRPGTVGQRRQSDSESTRLAKADGFGSSSEWYQHFRMMYGAAGITDDTQVFRIQLAIREMEKGEPARVDLGDVI